MKRIIWSLAVACLMLTGGVAGASILFHPKPIDLGVANVRQEDPKWCWAAVIQQILAWRGGSAPSQCELVNQALTDKGQGGTDCCQEGPDSEICSRAGTNLEVLSLITRLGGRVDGIMPPNTPEEIHEYLENGRVVIAGVQGVAGLNHAYVIRGISWGEDGQAMLLINDPAQDEPVNLPFQEARPTWILTMTAY